MLTRPKLHPLSPEADALRRALFGGFVMEDPAPADPAPSDPPADPAADPADPDPNDPADPADPNDPDPRVQRANRQAAAYRTQLRETQTQVQQLTEAQTANAGVLEALRKALTGDSGEGDGETDPAEVARQATERVTSLETENTSLRAQLLVHDLAAEANANPKALLDSRSFLNTLDALDASAEDYQDKVAEAITSAVSKNTNLRAGQGSRRGGSESAGGAGGDGTVTQEQFNAMPYKDRVALKQTNPTLYRKLADNETA